MTATITTPRTRVVNIYEEAFDVYAGNPCLVDDPRELQPGAFGFLGNPFANEEETNDGSECESVQKFRAYFHQRVKDDRRFRLAVLAAYGKRIGCLCDPGSSCCHARVIAEWLEHNHDAYRSWFGAPAS